MKATITGPIGETEVTEDAYGIKLTIKQTKTCGEKIMRFNEIADMPIAIELAEMLAGIGTSEEMVAFLKAQLAP